MQSKGSLWFWRVVWGSAFVIVLGLYALYAWLPADGATGDMESFRSDGFHVQWILEKRPNGLQVGDVIVRAGGHTFEEWLAGAPRGAEWRSGGVVTYEILRGGQPMSLDIRLQPVPLHAIFRHWGVQLLVALAFFVIGTFVFRKRPHEPAAQVLMLFCTIIALQYWGDAYNFQYATLPWRWPFAVQLAYELVFYGLGLAAISHFVLVFPLTHPVMVRFPRLALFALYAFHPIAVFGSMALAPEWSSALIIGSGVSWVLAILYIGSSIWVGLRSVRVADDPIARAQVSWILWCAAVGCAILVPGYILPLMLTSRPLIPHPVTMLIIALVPFALAMAVLRYRLFDIEFIINRTLVYGTLTALLAALYFLIVWTLTLLTEIVWQGGKNTVVVYVAALGTALAFDPLRRRVQHLINLAFYRAHLDYERLLSEMSERLATSIVLDELALLLTDELPRRLQIEWAALSVLDREDTRFVPTGAGERHPALPTDHVLVAYLHRSGKPLLFLQMPDDLPDEAQAFLDRHGIELSIRLAVGERLLGIYNLGAKLSGRAYSRDETRLLHLLGRQAAVAVENSRLFQAEREQRQLTQALQEAADVVSQTLDLNQVLDRLLEQVERVVAGDAFNVMLVEGSLARIVRWRGYESLGLGELIASLSMPIAQYPTLSRMVETGHPVVVPDTANDPAWVRKEGWEWLRSYVSAPIVVAGQTIGFLNVDRAQPSESGKTDAERLEALAHHAATALENARLYAEIQRQLLEQTALREAGAIISSTLDPEAVLSRIAEAMGLAIDVTSAYISSFEPEGLTAQVLAEYIGAEASPEECESDLGQVYPEESDPEWLEVMAAGQYSVSHIDDPDLPPSEREHMLRYGAKTVLYIPLLVKGQFIGYAELWESRRRREFTSAEISLCQDIARQAAVALENARLYQQAQQEIDERKRAEERIKASLAEKEVLLKEIHHRVKNNLQVISSLLYLQSKRIRDPETLEMFQDSQHRVRSMALVHERLYQAKELSRVDAGEYIHTLARFLFRSYQVRAGQIELTVSVDDVPLGIDAAVPCGLIVNELVSNSLKHAFPEGREGTISIELSREDAGDYVLTVGDDGIGFPAGLDFRHTESLGLQLVSALVDQLEGTVRLDTSAGTRFEIVFPASGRREEERTWQKPVS